MSNVLGVIAIVRSGDRQELYQDPYTYETSISETTALGEREAHELGHFLRSTYLDQSSSSSISGMDSDLVDNQQIYVRAKAGGEATVVFDSVIALLQGLFPPNPKNKIDLANGQTIVAPLNGYQYIPVETVEPINDRSMEPWTNCPNFEKHIREFYESDEFREKETDAAAFYKAVEDYAFGRPAELANAWNIFDYMNTQLTHNQSFAYRLPPTHIAQSRALANFHENGVFSDKKSGGIGNIAGRTILHAVVSALERVTMDNDPLQMLLIATSYQPFISLFHMLGITDKYPELAGIPDYSSLFAIELRRGGPPEDRDFLRFRFKNGTSSDYQTLDVFGKTGDIPFTEFVYRVQDDVISSNKQWGKVCGARSTAPFEESLGYKDLLVENGATNFVYAAGAALSALIVALLLTVVTKVFIAKRTTRYIRLPENEVVTQRQAPYEKRVYL